MQSDSRERPRWKVAVWLAIIVVAGAALLNGVISARWHDSRERTAQSEALLAATSDLRSHLVDAETGQRGYLLTGDDPYLDPYRAAQAMVAGDLDQVRGLSAGTSLRRDVVEQIVRLSHDKMAELDTTVALRKSNRGDVALVKVRSNRGKALMDSLRALVRAAIDTENDVLRARRDREEWLSNLVLVALVGGAVVTIGVLLYLLNTLTQYEIDQRAARREMELQLRDLESLVRVQHQDPAVPPPPAQPEPG